MGMSDKKILIIDDDEKSRENIRIPLVLRGYEVFEASDGFTGIRLARKHRPKVVLLDLLLPKVDGFRVARILKFDKRFQEMRFIAVTQLVREEIEDEIKRFGFDMLVKKPFVPEEFVQQIEPFYRGEAQV